MFSNPHYLSLMHAKSTVFLSLNITILKWFYVQVFLLLTNMYSAFDRLISYFGLYKVETTGNGIMLAAGNIRKPYKKKRPVRKPCC